MRDVASRLASALDEGAGVALATVVSTWGSGPRRPGARMVVGEDGSITGSVSGGCVEANVIEAAREVIAAGAPRLLEYAVSDETAWGVGLACGGALSVFVERPDRALFERARAGMDRREPVVWAVATGGDRIGSGAVARGDGPAEGPLAGAPGVAEAISEARQTGQALGRRVDGGTVFCDVILPPEKLVLVGGVHVAQTLARLAREVGYEAVVCDPRPVFASPERFPDTELVQDWPAEGLARIGLDAGTAVATLTHDPKLDDPALEAALGSDAFYVGALGSRRTHAKRLARLRERGLSEAALGRVRAPIGLPIGARSPHQIALSVMAEVVAARNGSLDG